MRTIQDDDEGDDYIDVIAVPVNVTEKAVLLQGGDATAWVPRSCLHGADDIFLSKLFEQKSPPREPHNFRMRGWVARQRGF